MSDIDDFKMRYLQAVSDMEDEALGHLRNEDLDNERMEALGLLREIRAAYAALRKAQEDNP